LRERPPGSTITRMILRLITVHVRPEYRAQFEAATAENHRGSIREEGVARFDVLRDEAHAGIYVLYEMYRDEPAVAAHKETAHYARWRETVEPMMEKPREVLEYTVLHPEEFPR
jgi:(4S)-4-hydroxy-5-phosphonooxypentane-2,3-dione isomerase